MRPDDKAVVADGKLSWPLQNTDLVGGGNTAGLLFHTTPATDSWIAETKLNLDLGEGDIRNYQQAGMIAYLNDSDFARLGNVVDLADPADRVRAGTGGAAVGRCDQLRCGRDRAIGADAVDAARVQQERGGRARVPRRQSVDGKKWTWGASWVLSATAPARAVRAWRLHRWRGPAGGHVRVPAVLREQVR